MDKTIRWAGALGLLLCMAIAAGCGNGGKGDVLKVDAEFDPSMVSDVSGALDETNTAVAQSFTVLADGRFEEFWIVVTQGESMDNGRIQITVRPTDAMGVPDSDPNSSIIQPIDVATLTLPATLVEEYTEFDVGNDPGREVVAGETYAIVVEFVSRTTNNDMNPIARVLGLSGDGSQYPDGTGSTAMMGGAFMVNTNDYFFRTFVLQ